MAGSFRMSEEVLGRLGGPQCIAALSILDSFGEPCCVLRALLDRGGDR